MSGSLGLHQKIFFATNGLGPYSCAEESCIEEVTLEEVLVHHVDHDHDNNVPENLVGMHRACHQRHHAKLRQKTPAEIERLRIASTGRSHTREAREKMSRARRGRVMGADTKSKISAGMKRHHAANKVA